ncbi:MAG TPA: agmatine deiminase family protein [Flavilitoribacter sp.]|nr:agmatine deiminase family protein [Flavilitoribacter sp.]
MKKPALLLLAICSFFLTSAQQGAQPHDFSVEESARMDDYLEAVQLLSPPVAPPAGVRTMAEWEEVEALVITWTGYIDVLTEIVRNAVNECRVIIIADDVAEVTNHLTAEGIPMNNVDVLITGYNTIWIRDYGPWTVYKDNVDSLYIADWIYNRPRPKDDVIPETIAQYFGLPYYGATTPPFDWVHTGGNHLRDGMGTAFSSDLVFAENPGKTEAEINNIAGKFLGVNKYVKFRRLPYDGIHHLDMHMLVIDEETLLVGEYPQGVSDGPQIEANIAYLRNNFTTPFGHNYRVERLPMPPEGGFYPYQNGAYRTYSNAIFINKTVLVPTYEEQYDTTALRIYRENLPGYNVVGITCNDIIQSLGALHCITKLIGTRDPLWIAHPRLRDTYSSTGSYPVEAILKHKSGILGATVFYKTADDAAYTPLAMSAAGDDKWTASIPAFPAGTEVRYYIQALSNSGKSVVRPQVAPDGYFRFLVKAPETPKAGILFPRGPICPGETIAFRDDSQGGIATWSWSFPGGEPAASNEPNPVVAYPDSGTYDVSLTVTNQEGAAAEVLTGAVRVEGGIQPFVSDFTGGIDPAWTVINENNDNAVWPTAENLACGGTAVMVDNYAYNTRFRRDYLRARFDLSELVDPVLHFDLAYAPRTTRYDELRVNATGCSGATQMIYDKTGSALATAPSVNSAFLPTDCSQWRAEEADLGIYAGEVVEIDFENIGGYGNRIYLGNIRISGNYLPQVAVTSPSEGEVVQLEDLAPINLTAEASDPEGQLAYVAFYVDGDSVGVAVTAPYTLSHFFPDFTSYSLTAKAVDAGGAFRWSAPVTFQIDKITGIAGVDPDHFGFSLSPNPSQGHTRLYFQHPGDTRISVRLSNAVGQTLRQFNRDLQSSQYTLDLDVRDLPSGIYWVSVRNEGAVISRQLLITR